MIETTDLNKFETLVINGPKPEVFMDTFKHVYHDFHDMYMRCRPIILDLIKLQNDIIEF